MRTVSMNCLFLFQECDLYKRQERFHKAVFSLKYTYVNNLFGTTAQSEVFQETRKPTEVIACLIIGFVLNTWILHTSKIFLL